MIIKSTDLLPTFQLEKNPDLQKFVESFMTSSRIDIIKNVLENRMRYMCLVAENFIDEFNVHAMIRTSECFGLQDFHNIGQKNVLMKKNKSVNRGAFQWTHIYDYTECEKPTLTCIKKLKSNGYRVYATSSHLEANYTPENIPIDQPLAVILGKEHEGISETALKHCDGLVTIPMYGFTESFNVSVAASLLTQTIVGRIRKSNLQWQFSDEQKENLYYEWIWHSIKYPDKLYHEWSIRQPQVFNGN